MIFFCNIFKTKREFEARLKGVQNLFEYVDPTSLLVLQSKSFKNMKKSSSMNKHFCTKNLEISGLDWLDVTPLYFTQK